MEKGYTNVHQDLIDRCRKGERSAQGKLYQQYAKAMYNIALRITNQREDAQDVLQDSFFNAFKQLPSYNEKATFGAWLKRIVVNRSIDCVKRRRHLETDLPDIMEETTSTTEPEVGYTMSWEVRQVQQAMEQLADGYRIVFSLYMLEGYDHEEISTILGVSVSTSKSQLNRAKKKIRELVNQTICHER